MAVSSAGCADGSARVWDVQTRQPLRTLSNPAKGPLTAVLVLDRPTFLAPGAEAGIASVCIDKASVLMPREKPSNSVAAPPPAAQVANRLAGSISLAVRALCQAATKLPRRMPSRPSSRPRRRRLRRGGGGRRRRSRRAAQGAAADAAAGPVRQAGGRRAALRPFSAHGPAQISVLLYNYKGLARTCVSLQQVSLQLLPIFSVK